MKPEYATLHVTFARVPYDVEVCIYPPRSESHDGPDSPRYLHPGSPLRVVILRVLRARVEMTSSDLLPITRRGIAELAEKEAKAKYCRQRAARGRAPAFCSDIPLATDELGQLRQVEDSR